MYENPEKYTSAGGLEKLPILINLQRRFKKGMILTPSGKKLVVEIADWLIEGVELHDYVEVKRDYVTGELIVVDYFINFEATNTLITGYDEEYGDLLN